MAYRDLIKELKQIVSVGLSEQQHDLNLAITYTNWEIGNRLIQVNQGGNARAAYGEQVLENISSDLRNSYGRGYSIVNLRLMRNFSKMYDKKSIRKELLWSHYRLLLQFKDETLRKKLENLTIKNSWGYRELAFHIQKIKKVSDQLTNLTKGNSRIGMFRGGGTHTFNIFKNSEGQYRRADVGKKAYWDVQIKSDTAKDLKGVTRNSSYMEYIKIR